MHQTTEPHVELVASSDWKGFERNCAHQQDIVVIPTACLPEDARKHRVRNEVAHGVCEIGICLCQRPNGTNLLL